MAAVAPPFRSLSLAVALDFILFAQVAQGFHLSPVPLSVMGPLCAYREVGLISYGRNFPP